MGFRLSTQAPRSYRSLGGRKPIRSEWPVPFMPIWQPLATLKEGSIAMGIMYSGDAYDLIPEGAENIAYAIPLRVHNIMWMDLQSYSRVPILS